MSVACLTVRLDVTFPSKLKPCVRFYCLDRNTSYPGTSYKLTPASDPWPTADSRERPLQQTCWTRSPGPVR